MSDPIKQMFNEMIDDRVKPLEAEIAELRARVPDELWGVSRVARALNCSVSTARRRIMSDPSFPRPIKKEKYKHNGAWVWPRDKWNPDDIREYQSSRLANSSTVGL